MKIAIDAIGVEKDGGGRSVVLNLIHNILTSDSENEYLIFVKYPEASLRQFPNLEQRTIPGNNRYTTRIQAQILIPRILRRENVDLVHYLKNLGVFFTHCKSLVTLHDATILNYPRFFPVQDVIYWRTIQSVFLKSVDWGVAVSEWSRRDFIKHYHLTPDKIKVIYNACDPIFRPMAVNAIKETLSRYRLFDQFILSVGNISSKKNYQTLIRAFAYLRKEYKLRYKLVIVGDEYWTGARHVLNALIKKQGLENDVIFFSAVAKPDLVAFYNAASLFAFPSLDEGFGIVLVEAMASGTPIVCSGTTAIPEVVGEAGLILQNALDEKELAFKMAQVIQNQDLYQSLRQKGLKRAENFSWQKAAKEYLKLYRRLEQ